MLPEKPDPPNSADAPDLSQRFVVQLDQGNFGGEIGAWQPLISAPTLPGALKLCSECLSVIQGAIGISITLEMPGLSRSFRIWDAWHHKAVVWEDLSGRLWADEALLKLEVAERATSQIGA